MDLRNKNICTKEECERLLSFTNNSSPLFILATCGISLYGSSLIGILLLFTHLLGSLTVGFLFKFWKRNSSTKKNYNTSKSENKLQNITLGNFGEILTKSIHSSISTLLNIGGFVVLFSVIISILNSSGLLNIISIIFTPICTLLNVPISLFTATLTGLLEVTNGVNLIANVKIKQISINIILTAFLLGFGGISILFQILSIVSKSDLSFKPYIIGKLLHGIFAGVYTFIIIWLFPIFNYNL